MSVSFKVDFSEFNKTLHEYQRLSKRTWPEICNTKAFYIARGATRLTPKADRAAIAESLNQEVTVTRKGRGGSVSTYTAPLAALIVNARQRMAGKPGLRGAEMASAIAALLAARRRSVAYLKSGWLPAIRKLEPLAKRGPARIGDSFAGARQYGQDKGYGTPATEGASVKATIENHASPNLSPTDRKPTTQPDALHKYGGPALQQAFDNEERSMRAFIDREMEKDAKQLGIKIAGALTG